MTIEDLAGDSSKDNLTKIYALTSKYEGNFNYLERSKEKREDQECQE